MRALKITALLLTIALAACGGAPEMAKAPNGPASAPHAASGARAEAPLAPPLEPVAPRVNDAPSKPDLRGIRIAEVPWVERRPAPPSKVEEAAALARREGSPSVDYGGLPAVRMKGEKDRLAVSVVLTHAVLLHQEKVEAWSFYQDNPEVPAVRASCGQAEDIDRVVETHSAAPSTGSELVYSYRAYLFNFARCKGRLLREHTTKAMPVLGNVAYVFRTRCPSCAEESRDELHLLTPSPGSARTVGRLDGGFFTDRLMHRTLPLTPGSSASLLASFFPSGVRSWDRVGKEPIREAFVTIHVETSFAPGEEAPSVVAWRQ